MAIQIGNHIIHLNQPSWGIGRVVGISNDGLRLSVRFSGRPREELQVSSRDPGVLRYRYRQGDSVRLRVEDEEIRVGVVKSNQPGEDFDDLEVEVEGELYAVLERNVVSQPPSSGVIESLARGDFGDGRAFLLRQETLKLDVERRGDALGALFSSRVMVKPYQVAVAQRVLSDRTPRYVLADEVGLGKTIEAGMIINALLHSRLAKRVLVVAPTHLTVQWLTELLHKFNLRFTLLDKQRLDSIATENPFVDPWNEHPLVIAPLELLSRDLDLQEAAASEENRWDLVIIDEAHHLRNDAAFEAAALLSLNTWGLLLLTATPLKLDPYEYFRLLRLIESAPAQSFDDFEKRIERQADLSALIKALEEASPDQVAKEAKRVARLFPADQRLAEYASQAATDDEAREALLSHVAEIYSLSARLIRNRRAVVGGFTTRKLHKIDVELDATWSKVHQDLRQAVEKAVKDGELAENESLASMLRRVDCSPVAAAIALAKTKLPELRKLARKLNTLTGADKDPKLAALIELVARLKDDEEGNKIIVFTESRRTLEYLVEALAEAGHEALWYHNGLSTLDRDRMVARFRSEDSAQILVSTEAGGEGRNFQFCHHLVHYDLPWSPSTIEQRIGRIDRVGQSRPVNVYVFRPLGTLGAKVADLFADDVQVFTETIGGLDPILEEVEGEILRLATQGDEKSWQSFGKRLAKGVARARQSVQQDYDPLLDRRSFDRRLVELLLERAYERFGLELDDDEGELDLEEALSGIARDLDERLEENVIAIAERIGLSVESDEGSEAFLVRISHSERAAEALAGFELEEDQVVEGTFWRDTAVEREEVEYLATGHPLVEALINHIRDGELGQVSALRLSSGSNYRFGACFSFVVQAPEAEDLVQGSGVPSRQAERLLESTLIRVGVELNSQGEAKISDDLWELLEDCRPRRVRPGELPMSPEVWEKTIRKMEAMAREEARLRLSEGILQAETRLSRELERRVDRLSLDAERGDEEEKLLRLSEISEEQTFATNISRALRSCTLVLDSAATLTVEPGRPSQRMRG